MDRKTATVTIGGKEIEFVELSFQESMSVDPYIPTDADGTPSGMALAKVYALAAVRKVNGEYVNGTANDIEWRRVAQMFTAFESFQLAGEYNRVFAGVESLESRVTRALAAMKTIDPADAVAIPFKLDELREILTVKPLVLTGDAVKNESSGPA